jgi:endonuclease/exonuclease/phosphatase family metal-dependent hydrolase
VLSVANYNMHCGMDGWGRPYDYLGAIASLDADVIVLEESWTPEGAAVGQAEEAARALGFEVRTHQLGEGRRILPQPDATDAWVAWPPWAEQNRALYMDGLRPANASWQTLERWQEAERGSFGIAMLVRPTLPIEATRLVHMSQLPRDSVRRAALVVDLSVDGHPISIAGTHMSHLLFGSPRNWSELRRQLKTEARPDTVLVGDMNTWGPLVHAFIPGWRRAVVGKTWPAWRPHSQIDHILLRGAVRSVRGAVLANLGSDHRPVRAELAVG